MCERGVVLMLVNLSCFAATVLAMPTASRSMSRMLSITRLRRRSAFIVPCFGAIAFFFFIKTGEESTQVFSIFEIIAQNSGGIGVMDYIFAKIFFLFQRVAD